MRDQLWLFLISGLVFFAAVGMWFYIIHTGWSRLKEARGLAQEVAELRADLERMRREVEGAQGGDG